MHSERLDRYLSFLESDPDNISLLNSTADYAYQAGELAQAQALAERSISLDNSRENNQAKSLLALASMANGELSQAKSIFSALIEEGENAPTLRYNLAYCHALEKNFSGALELLSDAEEHYADLPQMVHLKIKALHHLAEIESAITLAKEMLNLHPDDAALHSMLSSLYIDEMEFEQASLHAEKALDLGESNPEAYTSLGTLALAKQDDDRAIHYFSIALELKTNNGRAWLGKAMAEMLQKRYDDATSSFHSALTFMPEHLGTWLALAWCQLAQGNVADAENTINQSLAIDPNFAESHGTLAIIQLLNGDQARAQNSTRKALGLDRASFSGLYAQALLLSSQGQQASSSKIIQTLLDTEVVPNQGSLRNVLTKYL